MASRVFATQSTLTTDPTTGRKVPKFGLGENDPIGHYVRREFGDIVWVLDETDEPFHERTIKKIRDRLDAEQFGPNDYLLCIGNPILIGLMCVYAADWTDKLKFLQWDRRKGKYQVVRVDIEFP